jgi:hypothetical protein
MDYLNDADLLPHERRLLRAFGTPRRALDGRLVWRLDELPPHVLHWRPLATWRPARSAIATGAP